MAAQRRSSSSPPATRTHPTAAVYGGLKVGVFVRQLGDGRAITLGEVQSGAERWEWQLKGAGMTAFSRFGDGRAVLRSTIREYLCSEAMHHLGIPTTRALGIAGSADPVFREIPESAAVLSRVAPSHVRFGTFEYFHYRGDDDAVRLLADTTIARFFGEIDPAADNRYADFLRAVAVRTARMVAKWQAVGFEHGVMNTDNMSILGLTLDYGPFGFMERYDPGWVCNHSDEAGRYAFDRQPGVALWNCHALAAALDALLPREAAQAALGAFEPAYRAAYVGAMRAKLGLSEERPDDVDLILALLDALARDGADYSTFFRTLERRLRCASRRGRRWNSWPWLALYRRRVAAEALSARRAARCDARGQPGLRAPQPPGSSGDRTRASGRFRRGRATRGRAAHTVRRARRLRTLCGTGARGGAGRRGQLLFLRTLPMSLRSVGPVGRCGSPAGMRT